MSRNLYLGADTSLVLGSFLEGPDDLEARARDVFQQLRGNDFYERGEALVDEIQAARPHVVAMQEVVKVTHRNGSEATVVDHMAILDTILRTRGLPHRFLPAQTTTVVDLALADGGRLTFTDRLALLVRHDVRVMDLQSDRYGAEQPTPGGVTLGRGWMTVDCSIGTTICRIANTHLEVQAFPETQARQVEELMKDILSDRTLETFLMGDFNSNAEGEEGDPTWTPAHSVVRGAGFRDLWAEAPASRRAGDSPEGPGHTCCHEADLSLPGKGLDQRIDFIFHRGPTEPDLKEIRRVGIHGSSRTRPGGLWPSDHAGLVACVAVPPAGR
jgi:endonuclease/exonuclease/phosphatase family metal-dependent hydrolase